MAKATRKIKSKSDTIVPGGVDEYIAKCPEEVHGRLNEIRLAIREAATDSIETVRETLNNSPFTRYNYRRK
jgi:hypothetical protein